MVGLRALFFAIASVSGSQGVRHYLEIMKNYILNIQNDVILTPSERLAVDAIFLQMGV